MVKAVTFFLIGIIILGIFGKLRMPRILSRKSVRPIAKAEKCPKCGGYILGEGPCPCTEKK